MTGVWAPNMRTADIWRRTRKVSRMLMPLNSLKLSAQSPPWRRKARPMAASARRSSRRRASPENTIGGNASIVLSTPSSSAAFGYSGCCSAFFVLQLSTAHFPGAGAASRSGAKVGDEVFAAAGTEFCPFDGSEEWTARMVWRLRGRKDGKRRRCPPETAAAAAGVLVTSAIAEDIGGGGACGVSWGGRERGEGLL
jgi:hypothetical protein